MSIVPPTAAVIGVGRMGVRHLKALAAAGVRVVAIADARRDAIERARCDVPDAAGYDDWAELIRSHHPDLITVATTSPSHADIVTGAAEAGIQRILCEKPIATSLRAARAMADTCASRGTRLVVNHPRRRMPAYLAVRNTILGDQFGDLRFMRITCGAAGLANVGSHAFDLMRWFLGPPQAAIGRLDPHMTPNPRGAEFCDPGGHGTFWFSDGRRATFDFSNDFSSSFLVEFGCRYGAISVDERAGVVRAAARRGDDRSAPLHLYQTPTVPVELDFGEPIDIVRLTTTMIQDSLDDAEPSCSAADAIGALEMVAAVHLSAQSRAAVEFPLDSDHGCLARIP